MKIVYIIIVAIIVSLLKAFTIYLLIDLFSIPILNILSYKQVYAINILINIFTESKNLNYDELLPRLTSYFFSLILLIIFIYFMSIII